MNTPRYSNISRSKVIIRTSLAIAIVAILISVVAFLRYLNSPSVASTITSSPPKSSTQSFNAQSVGVSGIYASFDYPASLHPKKQQPVSGSTLAAYSYEYPGVESWELAINVNSLTAGSKYSDSGYYARIENPNKYKEMTTSINGVSTTIMTDTQASGYSKVGFLFHGSESADIALSSNSPQDQTLLDKTLNQVIGSWQWK